MRKRGNFVGVNVVRLTLKIADLIAAMGAVTNDRWCAAMDTAEATAWDMRPNTLLDTFLRAPGMGMFG